MGLMSAWWVNKNKEVHGTKDSFYILNQKSSTCGSFSYSVHQTSIEILAANLQSNQQKKVLIYSMLYTRQSLIHTIDHTFINFSQFRPGQVYFVTHELHCNENKHMNDISWMARIKFATKHETIIFILSFKYCECKYYSCA